MESRRVIFVVQMWCPLFLAFLLPVILFCPNACSVFVALVPLQALWSTVVQRKKTEGRKDIVGTCWGRSTTIRFQTFKTSCNVSVSSVMCFFFVGPSGQIRSAVSTQPSSPTSLTCSGILYL